MGTPYRVRMVAFLSCVLLLCGIGADVPGALAEAESTGSTSDRQGWPGWGGPQGDFRVEVKGLSDQWPANGPPKLWSRPLGDGYSAIVADRDRLFTMYREGLDEIVIALDAGSGRTVWEYRYPAEAYPGQTAQFGHGPNASPLILDGRLISIGFTGLLHGLDLESGKLIWKHDLVREFKAPAPYYGYSNSPIAYDGKVIVLVGGKQFGVTALDPADGSQVWKSEPIDTSYAAPVLINVDGQDQVVFFSPTEVIGMNPRNGEKLWSYPVVNFCRTNCTSVLWGDDNLLWAATKGVGGTRVIKLTRRDGKTDVEEVWTNRKIRLYHWNAIRIGDRVYASSGDSKTFLSVIDVKSGEIRSRQRGFASTNGIYADGKLILLDADGKLALAAVRPDELEIRSTFQLLDSVSWTVPTLVGRTLFVRDRKNIVALDLG